MILQPAAPWGWAARLARQCLWHHTQLCPALARDRGAKPGANPWAGAIQPGPGLLTSSSHFSGLLCSRGFQAYLGVQGVPQESPVGLGMPGGLSR